MISRSQTLNLKPTLTLQGSPVLKRTVAKALAVLKPPPDLTISDWADQNRRLSSEASAEPGQWRTSRAEYQRGIMDAISDPAAETVVIMSSSQIGKSESILNMVGYHIDHDPAPITGGTGRLSASFRAAHGMGSGLPALQVADAVC